jgi:hypothetical protein
VGSPPPLSRLERLLGKPPQPVGQIPAFDVDECSGPRRVVRPQARRPPGGGLRAIPYPTIRARESADSERSGISSSRAIRRARHPVAADQVGRPSAFPSGDPAPIGYASPSPRGQPDGEGLQSVRSASCSDAVTARDPGCARCYHLPPSGNDASADSRMVRTDT